MKTDHDDVELLYEVVSALRWASHSGARHVAVPEGSQVAVAPSDQGLQAQPLAAVEVTKDRTGQRLRARPRLSSDRTDSVSSEAAMTALRKRLGDCSRCRLHEGRSQIVFGQGPTSAALFIIGSGPGVDEDACGQLWQGEAGKLLDRMLVAIGLSRAEVYLASGVMCRSPDADKPARPALVACTPFLRSQLEVVAPTVVLVLGEAVSQFLFKTDAAVAELRGSWRDLVGFPTMVSHDPGQLLKNTALKREVWSDLKQVMKRLS
jgi:DNA polymerase